MSEHLPINTPARPDHPLLAVQDLRVAFGGKAVVQGLSYTLQAGQKLAIVGDGHTDCRFYTLREKERFLRAFGHGGCIGHAQAAAFFKNAEHRPYVLQRYGRQICLSRAYARTPDHRCAPVLVVKFYQ